MTAINDILPFGSEKKYFVYQKQRGRREEGRIRVINYRSFAEIKILTQHPLKFFLPTNRFNVGFRRSLLHALPTKFESAPKLNLLYFSEQTS